MQQLVQLEIRQALEKELDNYHELHLGALGRIKVVLKGRSVISKCTPACLKLHLKPHPEVL